MARPRQIIGAGTVAVVAGVGIWQIAKPPALSPQEAVPAVSLLSAPTGAGVAPERRSEIPPTPDPAAGALARSVQIDTLRIEADGSAVLAGRIAGYAREEPDRGAYRVLIDISEVATFVPQGDGAFVSFFEIPARPEPQRLSVVSPDEQAEPWEIFVAPRMAASAQDKPRQDKSQGAAGAATVLGAAPQSVLTAPPEAATGDVSVGPTLLVSEPQGVRVLTPSGAQGAGALPKSRSVVIDTISYSIAGDVSLTGRGIASGDAAGSGAVQLYLDNRPIATAPVLADGGWRIALPPEVDRGVYTLRLDQLSETGTVISRIESHFKREAPEQVAALLGPGQRIAGGDLAVRTVQPGNTLWAIARERYGEGLLYVHVYEANSDLIRDPDLIYPGQIFELPELPLAQSHARP